jgi:sec-independent protein translocase protein TatC
VRKRDWPASRFNGFQLSPKPLKRFFVLSVGCTWLKPGVNERSLGIRKQSMTLRDIFKFRDPPETETSKPFLEHLEDLRWTIVKIALTLAIAMVVCFAFRSTLVRIIQAPLNDLGSKVGTLKALGITDSIVISFHLAFYAGIVLSFPLLLYFLAEFVLPALTAVEKRFLFPAIAVSFALFLLGVLVCYFWLLPKTILFFFRDTESLGWAPTWTVQQYYSFVTRFTIGFGLAFELPVVVLALVRFGLITYRFMARTRPYAIVLIFILATIITPTPDILTLIAMALPMCLLYESCIWIAWLMERRASKRIAG